MFIYILVHPHLDLFRHNYSYEGLLILLSVHEIYIKIYRGTI